MNTFPAAGLAGGGRAAGVGQPFWGPTLPHWRPVKHECDDLPITDLGDPKLHDLSPASVLHVGQVRWVCRKAGGRSPAASLRGPPYP
jgi:hypothetical protein